MQEILKDNFLEENNPNNEIGEAFLLYENNQHEAKPRNLEINQNKTIENNLTSIQTQELNISLQEISLENSNSINEMISLLNSSFQLIRVLPIFLKNSFKFEKKENIDLATKQFIKLLSIYKSIDKHEKCLIGEKIKEFIEVFNILINKLNLAKCNFSHVLPNFKYSSNENENSFIIPPKICVEFVKEKEDKWKIKISSKNKNNQENEINNLMVGLNLGKEDLLQTATYRKIHKKKPNLIDDIETKEFCDDKNDEDERLKQEEEEKRKKKKQLEIEEQKMKELIQKEIEKINETNDLNIDSIGNFDNNRIESSNSISKETTETYEDYLKNYDGPSKGQLKDLVNNFSEEDAMKILLDKLKSFKEDFLDIGEEEKAINARHISDTYNMKEYPIKNLLTICSDISAYLISCATDENIPYSELCVNILFDTSFFISDENKLFNMFLLCCIVIALFNLEIPYSITLISDEKFKCTIKRFSDQHSQENLQKVLDCIFVRRFYTNLANNTKFAINTLFYSPPEERKYRAFITFTNGLDERLFMPENWKSKVFNTGSSPEKNKFGYIFLKGEQLIDENLDYIREKWKKFESVNQDKVKLTIIDSDDKYQDLDLNKANDSNNLINKLGQMFLFVLQFPNVKENNEYKPSLPNFNLNSLNNLTEIENLLVRDFSTNYEIYTNKTDSLLDAKNISVPLNNKHYKKYFGKIIQTKIEPELKQKLKEEILKMKESKYKLGPNAIETTFKCNYATQKVLSTQGSEFDITALIFHLINPSPNPRIYLQKKINDKRRYGISIVVDSSYSCYNELSGSHAFQTLRALLSCLMIYELPSLDFIVSGEKEPYILCSNTSTLRALKGNSTFWEGLFEIIQRKPLKTDLFSAIVAAYDLKRLHNEDYPTYLFVLTDGLYGNNERNKLKNIINVCCSAGMNVFGIGVGIYPLLIDKLFPQVVYCQNPSDVMKGIASFMGENISSKTDSFKLMFSEKSNMNKITSIFNDLKTKINNPIFKDLKLELEDIDVNADAMSFIINQDSNKSKELLRPGVLKSQKILLIMLWDCSMSNSENYKVDPDYIEKPPPGEKFCLGYAVNFFGIQLKIVQDYNDAINELTTDDNGECPYYAVWIICGPPYDILPKKEADPHLVGEFNDVLIQFWKNKGSIVFLAEGTPLCYQVNLFLEYAEFPGFGKTNIRIGGEHKANKKIKSDNTGKLINNGTYDSSLRLTTKNDKVQKSIVRPSLSRSLNEMYEGDTISYACKEEDFKNDYLNKNIKPISDVDDLKPFKGFIKNSDGGISCLVYNDDTNTYGDIIIYCGFTFLFLDMQTEDSSYRFFQNIVGYTARPDIHMILDQSSPFKWRPKTVIKPPIETQFTFQERPVVKIKEITPPSNLINLFCFDNSGSISGNTLYFTTCTELINKYYKNGDLFYLWGTNKYKKDYNEIMFWINQKKAREDTKSELVAKIALENLNICKNVHLILVTDGETYKESINESDKIMKDNNIIFGYVSYYLIGSGVNYQVGVPYSRGCPNQTIRVSNIGERTVEKILLQEDLNALENIDNINTYEQFLENVQKISKALIAKLSGKEENDDELLNKLEKMKNRVDNDLSMDEKCKEKLEKYFKKLKEMVTGGLKEAFTLDSISGFSF